MQAPENALQRSWPGAVESCYHRAGTISYPTATPAALTAQTVAVGPVDLRMLMARLGRRRIIFTDAERRLLARHAKAVGRKRVFELDPIVVPDTLLR